MKKYLLGEEKDIDTDGADLNGDQKINVVDMLYLTGVLTEDIKIWLAQWEVEKPTADFPYDFWQYCDDLVVGNIVCDGNLCEGQELLPDNDIIDIDICKSMAVDVIYGKYGNGEQRKEILGIYYDEVQKIVNDMYRIIKGD